MRTYWFLIATLSCFLPSDAYWDKINTIVSWKRLQFAYRTEAERLNDIRDGIYNPDAPAPIDADVYYPQSTPWANPILFVTIPKFGPGVPVTLGTVTNKVYQGDRLIEPFPSWEWHRNLRYCNFKRLVSVFRVKIDRCGLLWVLDAGGEGNGIICKPQLLVFDLKKWPNVKLYYKYEFPEAVFDRNTSLFVTPEIESFGDDCKGGAFAYVADVSARALVVTRITYMNRGASWRIKDISMNPELDFYTYNIAGQSFELDDGILGMALSPDSGYLYYSALSGSKLARISTTSLKNAVNTPPYIKRYASPRSTQSAAMAISKCGVAFFGLISDITINCWNTKSDDYGRYIGRVYSNSATMQFPSGMKIVENPAGREELWVVTNRLQKQFSTGYNFSETNFRISMGYVTDLLENSRCNKPNY